MNELDHIAPQDRLSQYRQICCLVSHVLSVAGAGGMSEKRIQTIYRQILDSYSTMDGEAFWLFRDEIIRILVMPDKMYDETKPSGGGLSPWSHN